MMQLKAQDDFEKILLEHEKVTRELRAQQKELEQQEKKLEQRQFHDQSKRRKVKLEKYMVHTSSFYSLHSLVAALSVFIFYKSVFFRFDFRDCFQYLLKQSSIFFPQIEKAFLEQKKADENILRLAEAHQVFSLLPFPFFSSN